MWLSKQPIRYGTNFQKVLENNFFLVHFSPIISTDRWAKFFLTFTSVCREAVARYVEEGGGVDPGLDSVSQRMVTNLGN